MRDFPPRLAGTRRPTATWIASAILVATFSVLSCGREVTGPENGVGSRYARGVSFAAEFPEAVRTASSLSAGVVDFVSVRVVFTRTDASVALDRVIPYPSGSDSVLVSLDVPLSNSTTSSGETFTLTLAYINAAGDTVFRGGPTNVTVVPTVDGAVPPAPFNVPVVYTGVGSNATSVAIAPDTIVVTSGNPFAGYSAVARDAGAALVPAAPISWRTAAPDTLLARVTAPAVGTGVTFAGRGPARVIAQLLTGPADTATLVVLPRPGRLVPTGGGGQVAPATTTLPLPILIRSLATDTLVMGGVPITMAVTAGGGNITASAATTDSSGFASFGWTLGPATGTQSVTVSSAGVPDLVITATATPGGPTQLVITQQPGVTMVAGTIVTPAIVVEARNAANVLQTAFTDSVTLAINNNPGNDTLGGVHRVRAVAGVATFDALSMQRTGTGYTINVNASGLTSATTSPFNVTAAVAAALVLQSGGAQMGAASGVLAQPVVVRVNDAYGNGIAGHEVAFGVAGGSVGAALDTTDATGVASTSWTLGAATGAQTLTATAPGLLGSPLSITATATAGAVTTDLAAATDTITAIGSTRVLVATSRNAALAVVPGTYTWTSRAPAIATVNGSGLVTSVAIGETWIVVTEVEGSSDSTLLVVDQRLATINVTPGTRDIYLGASYPFVAQAVDGMNVPLAVQPTFTWDAQSSAIASVSVAGVATGVGLGNTLVRATSAGVTGVATLNVRTPITRIAVVRDSATFVTTDTFSLAALARTRSYRAVAYDTLDAVMTGITFTWASSNPSVATLDSTGSATARAVATANGFAAIRASAQGVTGAAALTVAQVMTAVRLTPINGSIAPTGRLALTARRLDANGYFMPGGSFTYTSDSAAVATVSTTGEVTGVAIGVATIHALSGAIASDTAVITVSNSVPASISFGRDTLAVGRSATNVPIPVYLSRPHTSAVTVFLAVADTFAFFSPTSITIPPGSTIGTANLNGRNAGSTRITATDSGGGGGYSPDTAVLAVQATVFMATSSYNLVANDQLTTQVRLSDPAPSGGSFITFNYGTPGRASLSPDPVFIPQGQLAGDVVLLGLAAGTSTITPVATGVNGNTATVAVTSPDVTISGTQAILGAGQEHVNAYYAYVPSSLYAPLTLTMASSDTTVMRTASPIGIAAGIYYQYFSFRALNTGSALLSANAAGWRGDTMNVIVTTPRIGTCCNNGGLQTTSPVQNVSISAQDSLQTQHTRTSALAIQLSSTDTTVIRVLTPNVTIPAGGSVVNAQFAMGGNPGTAHIIATASGHGIDSTTYTVVGPKLEFSWGGGTPLIGAGQQTGGYYIYAPNSVTDTLRIALISSDSTVMAPPDTVKINPGIYYTYFTLRAKTPGLVSIRAVAAGYQGDTAAFRVTTPRLAISAGTTYDNFAPPAATTAIATDSVGTSNVRTSPLIVTYTTIGSGVISVTLADTIPAGSGSTSHARVTFLGVGTDTLIATAPGHGADTAIYTVRTPKLNFAFSTALLGRRQSRADLYLYVPNTLTDTLDVTVTQSNPAVVSIAPLIRIPTGIYYQYFDFSGLATGSDTLIISAPGYLPDTAVITVTTPRLIGGGIPGSATTTAPPFNVYVTTADSVGGSHISLDTLLIRTVSNNPAVLQADSAGFRILPGTASNYTTVRYVGPGTGSLTFSDSLGTGYTPVTSNSVTVTGPSLALANGTPTIGMRQNDGSGNSYVYVPNNVTSPLVVRFTSSDTTVVTPPDSVIIPTGGYYVYFPVRSHDATGTIQITATATGYSAATMNVQVTAPRFLLSVSTSLNTTSAVQPIYVTVADAAGNARYSNDSVTVTLTSSSPGVASIDSTSVVIPAGAQLNQAARLRPLTAGTTTVTASDARVQSYRYNPATANVSVNIPNLSYNGATPLSIGIGQWSESQYISTPDYQVSPLAVSIAHLTGTSQTAATETIPGGIYYRYFRITGVSAGNDSLTYTAPGHNLTRSSVNVGQGNVFNLSGWPTALTTAAADSVLITMYARSPDGQARNVSVATTFSLSSPNGRVQFVPYGTSTPATSVTIPVDAQYVQFWLKGLSVGSESIVITNANYVTYTNSVTVNP